MQAGVLDILVPGVSWEAGRCAGQAGPWSPLGGRQVFRPGWSLGSPGRQAGVLARLVSFSWLVTLLLVLGVILTNTSPTFLALASLAARVSEAV